MTSLNRAFLNKQQAEKILKELQLIEKWNEIGDCFVVGATAYDLIVKPDIDLETFCEEIKPEIIMQELAVLLANPNVIEFKYRDYSKSEFNGHYFKLVYQAQEVQWTIDMWLFSINREGALSRDIVPFMKNYLTTGTREIILDIKEALIEKEQDFSSVFIYQAVLEFGVKNVDEFIIWSTTHNTTVPYHWRPKAIVSDETVNLLDQS